MKTRKLLRVMLCSLFCLTTLVGCSEEDPYKMAEAQTLDYNGIPVYIEPDEKTLQTTIDKYFEQLEKQPDYLMRNCTEIHFQCEDVFAKTMLDSEVVQNEADAADYSGLTTDNTTVYMNTSWKKLDSMVTDEETFKETLTHELWHVYDFTHQIGDSYPSDNVQIVSIYNQNPSLLGEYGATNTLEFFAEAGQMYIYKPDKLKEKSEELYNFFESLPKE